MTSTPDNRDRGTHAAAMLASMAIITLGVWIAVAQPGVQAQSTAAAAAPIIVPGLQYLGNASCSGSKCHTANKATEQSGHLIGDENNIWDSGDPHSHAFYSLEAGYARRDGKFATDAIVKKLNIADATKSDRCLSCHAINAPAAQRGDKFRLQNAVGCEACHGPSQKWREPHAKAGWTAALRKEIGADGLFKQHGLIDTSNLAVRAQRCVICHVKIDKALVDAGHPPLKYDQYAYNTIVYKYFKYYDQNPDNDNDANPDLTHWSDPSGAAFTAKLWATGQAAAMAAAQANLKTWGAAAGDGSDAANLLAWYTDAMAVIEKHFKAKTAEDLAKADITAADATAAAADFAAMAPKADTAIKRWGIVQALAALGDIFTNGDQAFWDGYNAAVAAADAGGEPYLTAVKTMAAKIK